MGKKWHKPEEIVAKLRQVEVLTAQGKSIAAPARRPAERREIGAFFGAGAAPIPTPSSGRRGRARRRR